MKITIDVSTMQNHFAACGRDYYSWEGYEALLAYYNDIETDDEFDQDDYIVALVKKLEQRTTVLHVSNGNYIIFA